MELLCCRIPCRGAAEKPGGEDRLGDKGSFAEGRAASIERLTGVGAIASARGGGGVSGGIIMFHEESGDSGSPASTLALSLTAN